jgi:hypothetical protein
MKLEGASVVEWLRSLNSDHEPNTTDLGVCPDTTLKWYPGWRGSQVSLLWLSRISSSIKYDSEDIPAEELSKVTINTNNTPLPTPTDIA